eukprot:CAMPEP_0196662448 /NCGR_PEP_ID=MMETSP1086-20130531/48740_1 /TAXON_ID=77921 /ORGANISM="Cyanoptyche  gloeocystis , Strain SAG4.97" /LENGTH=283 /DNA_ID=CAMNT_0041997837 /DNA_START=33 /DNA_END=883 /DNA_ORIENTATION=-
MSLQFPNAAQPDIVRAWQKDEFYRRELQEDSLDVVSRLYSTRTTAAFYREIRLLADALFFGLTTLSGRQTLGEEYCDILQVTGNNELPSTKRRALLVSLDVVGSFLLSLAPHLRVRLTTSRPRRTRLSSVVAATLASVPLLSMLLTRAHLAFFYSTGLYYEIVKRLAGIKYICATRLPRPRDRYTPLALVAALELFLHLYTLARMLRSGPSQTAACADVEEPCVIPKHLMENAEHIYSRGAIRWPSGSSASQMLAMPRGASVTQRDAMWARVLLDVHHRLGHK